MALSPCGAERRFAKLLARRILMMLLFSMVSRRKQRAYQVRSSTPRQVCLWCKRYFVLK